MTPTYASQRRFTVAEAAAELGISDKTLYRLMAGREIGYVVIGSRRRLLLQQHLDDYLKAHEMQAFGRR